MRWRAGVQERGGRGGPHPAERQAAYLPEPEDAPPEVWVTGARGGGDADVLGVAAARGAACARALRRRRPAGRHRRRHAHRPRLCRCAPLPPPGEGGIWSDAVWRSGSLHGVWEELLGAP